MKNVLILLFSLLLSLCVFSQSIQPSGPVSLCQGKTVVLTLSNPPGNANIQWQKDGADIAGAKSSTLSVTTAGSYTVDVKSNGQPATYGPVVVSLYQYPAAGFTFTPNNQCSTTPVNFTNASTGTGLTYTWTFDDPNSGGANSSTATDPQHRFIGAPGNGTQSFGVKLVADNNGCRDSITKTVTTLQIPGVQLGGTGSVVYNGLNYFTKCASVTSDFIFTNQSSTRTTNTSYTIKWGDGTADFTASNFTSTTHTYGIGNYHLQLTVTGQNGCTETGDYYVFVGNNPAVGLNNPGNTFICSQSSITFPISGTTNNPPGTVYSVFFNDGSSPVSYTHPAPADVTHFFSKGSCGTNSGTFFNSFQANIQASNPCGTSAAAVVPIYVSEKTKAVIGYSPDTVICVSTPLTVTNQSGNGYGVSSTGVCTPGKGIWTITPATGWTLTSGSLGDDFGSTDPSLWLNGSNALTLRFTTPGTYSIKLKTSATQLCGGDEVTKTFCVNPAPTAAFTLSANQGCAPLTVTTTNNSNTPLCKPNTYQWSVGYSSTAGCTPTTAGYTYVNGTSATADAPQFQFTNPGVYTISLVTKNAGGLCTSTSVSQTVTVKTKPTASLTAPTAVCQNGTINPSATLNNCYASNAATYAWSFPGGVPSSSTSPTPGAVQYATAGTYTITLEVTNECGTTTVTRNITVNPAPDVLVPANKTFCAGSQSGSITFSSSVNGTTFSWTNSNTAIGLPASGTGNIGSFTATNATGSPISAVINVTPTSGCAGLAQSFSITVNPRPGKPVVTRPVNYCLNETASPLSATAASGNAVTWYTAFPLSGGTALAPTPSTTTATSTTYYATQTNSYSCESDTAKIAVVVSPAITNNVIGSNQTICNGSSATPLTSTGPLGGGSGSFQYQWQQSTDGATWNNIAAATSASFNPGAVTSTTKYRRIVVSSTCADTSNTVTIDVQGSLTNADISGPQTICQGTQPNTLTGQLPTGGGGTFTYQWERSINNNSWNLIAGETAADYTPPVLTTTTYYRRKTTSGQCSVYSSAVAITVNPIPVMNAQADKLLCNGSPSGNIAFSSSPAATSSTWTNDNPAIGLAGSGTGNIASFTSANTSNPKVPASAMVKVVPVYTNNNVSCVGDTANFRIIVLPTVSLAPIPNEVKCTGQVVAALQPAPDTGAYIGTTVNYAWTVSGSGITLTASGNGPQIPAYATLNNGASDVTATITVTPRYTYSGKTCDGTPVSYTVTVKPATAAANAGPDQVLCAQTMTTLTSSAVNGTSGIWSGVGNSATIVSSTSNITQVTGLQPGTVYTFVWTQTGFASCPATIDTIIIDNKQPLENKIDATVQTVCAGTRATVAGQMPTGGSGSYTYQWQQSTDGINFSNIAGATLQNITFTPISTVWLRRLVNAAPCNGISDTAQVIVQPALANNVIGSDQAICTGKAAAGITGSLPTGGDSRFTYMWEQSTNGGASWTPVAGAISQDYFPGVLTQTTQFRRIVSTNLCNGAFGSSSNTVTITVNPDAKASFLPTDTMRCPPFNITAGVINLQVNNANSSYLWYVNSALAGSGSIFPGYVMNRENDTIVLMLKVVSRYGCKDDSMTRHFYTPKLAHPAFTLSDTVGCGPLTVQATNLTADQSMFTYFWDFGNGQTSTQATPPSFQLQPNPTFGDTIYHVRLKVFSLCDTLVVTKGIRVKSKPKALFTPTKTTGCSPMKVSFRNTSGGTNSTYYWDFGDGAVFTTTALDAIEHTFVTGVVDTFYVKLRAENECGSDSQTYSIVVAPNSIKLNLAINGTEHAGCEPHPVSFINNSRGASLFQWNFGDGALTTTAKNTDTVSHLFTTPGTYTVTLRAINSCSDTTTTETIIVYPKPRAAFTVNKSTLCIGDTARLTNGSANATAYRWNFGDGTTSTLASPVHTYRNAGTYTVVLLAYRNNPSGNLCSDSVQQTITVAGTLAGTLSLSDSASQCAPLTVTMVNQNRPSVSALWDLGDGTTAIGDSLVHTYSVAGIYGVKLTTVAPGGCTYITNRTISVSGPKGTLQYSAGNVCAGSAVRLQAVSSGATSYAWDFGDGQTQTTTQATIFHNYTNPGNYLPRVTLQSTSCRVLLTGTDTIKVDQIDGGFQVAKAESCGVTTLQFTDTSHVFSGVETIRWSFGDNTTGIGATPVHQYTASGRYSVQMIVQSKTGCADTVTRQLDIFVKSKPLATISAPAVSCTSYEMALAANVQSTDALDVQHWRLSNGATATGSSFRTRITQPGTYDVQFIAGTINGCYDTAYHRVKVDPSPVVSTSPSQTICQGNSVQLNASGAASWQWLPLQGLSCYTCGNPVASPTQTTPYIVEGKNNFGCIERDTVVITVIQPLKMTVSPNDSICIGQSSNLLVRGGTAYNWTPAQGLNSTTISNPTATPAVTTTYRIVGYDGFNCFTDTAFVTVAVGPYPTVNLGPDLTLAAGTLQPLTTTVTNGPIRTWNWTPIANLSCTSCAVPTAEIKRDIAYTVKVTTPYGCSASDTVNIKVFCESAQVFVPNAFTPDGDGINDVLMVRAKGVVSVKYFRIFNRWGEVVFEKSNFPPNNPQYGWDGKIRGIVGGPDVFVYTCEVTCENGTPFTYKGNVSIIK